MNICFHYFAVKALAVSAGLPAAKAQLVAEYSQFIDDYSTKDTISADWAPNDAVRLGLAVPDGGRFRINLVTTGFVTTTETIALYDETLQNNLLVPFHFIPTAPLERGAHYNDPVVPATIDGKDLISQMLWYLKNVIKTAGHIGNLSDEECIRIGCLLHVFADTYAHQRFCGHWVKDPNNYEIEYVFRHRAQGADVDVTSEFNSYIIPYAWLPTIGHTTVGHAPDDTDVRFKFKHRNFPDRVYERDSSLEFLIAASEIYNYLCACQGSIPNFLLIQPKMEKAFLANNYDYDSMRATWRGYFPNASFDYGKDGVMNRLFPRAAHESPEAHERMLSVMLRPVQTTDEVDALGARQVNVSQEFYDFSMHAFDHRAQVTQKLT